MNSIRLAKKIQGGYTAVGLQKGGVHNFYTHLKVKEKLNISPLLAKLKISFNPVAKNLRSRTYKSKVIQSKKLYNRKKEKIHTLKAAAKKED